jgi:hypothetical protein
MFYKSDDDCKSLKPLWTAVASGIPTLVFLSVVALFVKHRYAKPLKEAKKALVNNQVRRVGHWRAPLPATHACEPRRRSRARGAR